jgi:RecA/RadA recombinase
VVRPAHENPFRTARLHALAFRYPAGDSEDRLIERLAAAGGRGAILGPHGSGKTTLCLELASRFRADGMTVRMLRYGEDPTLARPRSLGAWVREAGPQAAVFVDGAGHLGPLAWWSLLRASRGVARLIVTAHRRCPLPTLLRTRATAELLAELCADLDQPMSTARSKSLLTANGDDVRAALRSMYDAWAEQRP